MINHIIQIMKTLYHKDIPPFLRKIETEPEFQTGSKYVPTGQEWYRQKVFLEFPLGEIAKDMLTTITLIGTKKQQYKTLPIEKNDRFNAQGLEGKMQVEKEFFSALMNMRDLLPPYRGKIICD